MLKYALLILLILAKVHLLSAHEPFPIGARSWGMGNASVALADRFSIFNNPAGLGFLSNNFISTSYHSRFEMAGLSTLAFSGNITTKFANFGLGFERFGDKYYNEQSIGLGIGKATERIALGLKVDYLQTAIDGLNSRKTLVSEFGVMAKLSSKIQIGFHVYNLTGASLYADQKLPMVLKVGANFRVIKDLLLAAEVEKAIGFPVFTDAFLSKVGLEYTIIPNVFFRTGLSSQVQTAHFGLGFIAKHFYFDYAASSNQALGFSHHVGLSFQID